MESPKVSVIIPVYNGASYIGEAMRSVLNQTYQNFELIVVDDASTDNSDEVISQFTDPRIIHIRGEHNRGSNITRNIGIRASDGDLIAFLDQDDYFHPEKLQAHISYYRSHPQAGFTYNARFELSHVDNSIRGIWRPPRELKPENFLLGFPVAPSDIIITRDWASRVGLMDEKIHFYGGEYVLLGRLYILGCEFGNIDRALNYRRRHAGRVVKNLAAGCESEIQAQERVFSDGRCTSEMLDYRELALANTYLSWGCLALAQQESSLGQEYLRRAFHLNHSILAGDPPYLLEKLVHNSLQNDSVDHVIVIRSMFEQLPAEAGFITHKLKWAIGRGYILKGVQAVFWGCQEDSVRYFREAGILRAEFDKRLLNGITSQILSYESEFGLSETDDKVQRLVRIMSDIGARLQAKMLIRNLTVNRAFHYYRRGDHRSVPRLVLRAIRSYPGYLINRGVLSIFVRSLLRSVYQD